MAPRPTEREATVPRRTERGRAVMAPPPMEAAHGPQARPGARIRPQPRAERTEDRLPAAARALVPEDPVEHADPAAAT
jgi:polysaccharide deacetylase 2 family uncharacterized protein YibQ